MVIECFSMKAEASAGVAGVMEAVWAGEAVETESWGSGSGSLSCFFFFCFLDSPSSSVLVSGSSASGLVSRLRLRSFLFFSEGCSSSSVSVGRV
jgi:hypothetical protein